MPWQRRPKNPPIVVLTDLNVAELFRLLEIRLVYLVDAAEYVDAAAKRDALLERLKKIVAECDLSLLMCGLPGCGSLFVPTHPQQKFCSPDHQQTYNNKWVRGANG